MTGKGGARGVWWAMSVQLAGTVFCAAVSFGLLAWLARALDKELFGIYVLVLSAASLALILVEGGWPTLVYRDAVRGARERAGDPSAMRGGVANLLLVVGAMLSVCAILGVADLAAGMVEFAAAIACMGLVALMNLVSGSLRGVGRFALEAAWQASGRAVSALVIVLCVSAAARPSVTLVFVAWTVGLLAVIAGMGRGWLAPPDWRTWRQRCRTAFPLMSLVGGTALLLKADVLLLGLFRADAHLLSDYAASTRLVEAAVLLFAPVTNVLLRSFRLLVADRARFRTEVGAWAGGGLLLGTTLVPLSLLFGEAGMRFIFGADYDAAGGLLPWVMMALGPMFCNLVLIQAWLAVERDAGLARRVFGAAAVLAPTAWCGWMLAGGVGVAVAVALVQTLLMLSLAVGVLRPDR